MPMLISPPLSAMRSPEPGSQCELQRQRGLRVVEPQQGRTALQGEGRGHRWPRGRVQLQHQPLWADGSALWAVLHGHRDGGGPRLPEPMERQRDTQDWCVKTLQRIQYIYASIFFKMCFFFFLFSFKEEQVTNTVNIRNMLPDKNKIKIQIMLKIK